MVAIANTPNSPGCKPSHAVVLNRIRISFDTNAPCVLGLLGFRSAEQDRAYDGDH
ncbi:MAG TPA: hypothetical protein VIJ84_02285 [Gaiellaceae bacterium]